MIFVPSRGGISHNEAEWTSQEHCAAGAQVLLNAVLEYDRAWKAAAGDASGATRPARYIRLKNCSSTRPPRSFARIARRAHRNRHRALNFVPIKIARRVAVSDPGALHGAKLCNLLVLKRVEQAFEIFVEEIVPNRRFKAVTIGRTDIGGAFGRLSAWVTDEFEQVFSLDRIQIVLVFRRTVTNGRDLFRRRLTRFRLRARQWQRGRYDGDRQQISCCHYLHRVFSKISRPISMRRISLVPAPIS